MHNFLRRSDSDDDIELDAGGAVRIDLVEHTGYHFGILQRLMLSIAPPNLRDMEQEDLIVPFQRADLIKTHAENMLFILQQNVRSITGSKCTLLPASCLLTCTSVGARVVLRVNPEAGRLWWAMHKMVHYSMFSTDNMPMGDSHEDLNLTISTQDIITVEAALAQIIDKMNEHLDYAGGLQQVNRSFILWLCLLLRFC